MHMGDRLLRASTLAEKSRDYVEAARCLGATDARVMFRTILPNTLTPIVVHSTSWRRKEGRIILTYVAVVSPPSSLPPDSLVAMPVRRAELARGEAMSAPKSIGVEAVLEHALRHLSWLIRDDPAVMTALAGWQEVLAGFEPEPFRALA